MIFRRDKSFPVQKRILDIKKSLRPEPYDWYRFDSFANIAQLEKILPGGVLDIPELAGGEPVADIGAADGDLAFLIESLGCDVTVIDWPGTNANQMRGVELLKRELASNVRIRAVDIDEQFDLPAERFGVAVCLGLLYHLKNPFFFLEKLSRHARHCLLSTRILPRTVTNEPVAQLTSYREFEDDPTNFWFFSENGLRRLIDRTGWEMKGGAITGNGVDDRMFCSLESRFAQSVQTFRLTHGWNELESDGWRWTQKRFGIKVESPQASRRVELHFRIVQDLLDAAGGVLVLSASVNGLLLEPVQYDSAGDHVYSQAVGLAAGKCDLQFQLSHVMEPDERQLGIIVVTPSSGVVSEASGLRLL